MRSERSVCFAVIGRRVLTTSGPAPPYSLRLLSLPISERGASESSAVITELPPFFLPLLPMSASDLRGPLYLVRVCL